MSDACTGRGDARAARQSETVAVTQVAACVPGDRVPGGHVVVERIGVSGRTLTFLGLWPAVDGLRPKPARVAEAVVWSSSLAARPRSSLGSPAVDLHRRPSGRPVVAFAWINPFRGTAWIVVDQPGFGEVYPVAGRLPVRVCDGRGHRLRPRDVPVPAVRRTRGDAGEEGRSHPRSPAEPRESAAAPGRSGRVRRDLSRLRPRRACTHARPSGSARPAARAGRSWPRASSSSIPAAPREAIRPPGPDEVPGREPFQLGQRGEELVGSRRLRAAGVRSGRVGRRSRRAAPRSGTDRQSPS